MKAALLLFLFAGSLVDEVAASGQVTEIATPSSERLAPASRIAPGPPPTLGFRLIDGRLRHRFGDLDLVLDDAGH
jgi:hypothetical protein